MKKLKPPKGYRLMKNGEAFKKGAIYHECWIKYANPEEFSDRRHWRLASLRALKVFNDKSMWPCANKIKVGGK